MPLFKIICNPIDINSPDDATCKVMGDGFDADWAIKSYNITWNSAPLIEGAETYRGGEGFRFKPSQLLEDKEYNIFVEMFLFEYPEVKNTTSYEFRTGYKIGPGRTLTEHTLSESVQVNRESDHVHKKPQKTHLRGLKEEEKKDVSRQLLFYR